MTSPLAAADVPNIIRVLSFNTGNDFASADGLAELIQRTGVSVAGLVELSEASCDSVKSKLDEQLPYQILKPGYIHGKGLVSAYPIHRHEHQILPSGRSVIDATLTISGGRVRVLVIHLSPPQKGRLVRPAAPDVEIILSHVDASLPTLMLGDFNFIRPSRGYRMLEEAGFVDTFRAVGRGAGPTYPARKYREPVKRRKFMRLDYIWATAHFTPMASWTEEDVGSDHAPVVSVLSLQELTR